jgi:hypothetical protein
MNEPAPATLELSADDAEHLRLLSIFHYVVAGMQFLIASFPVIHLAMGIVLVFFPGKLGATKANEPPELMGWFFILFAGVWMLVGYALVACTVMTARYLKQRRRYLFCLVIAGICAATCMPFGTVLGVFTIIVLMRPSVKAAFR